MANNDHGKHHSWFANTIYSAVDGDTILEGNGNYNIIATGTGTHITLGDGNHFVSVSSTNDVIAFGNTPGMSWIDSSAGIAHIAGGNGNVDVHAGGNDNTVILGDGHDAVLAPGMYNTIYVGSPGSTHDVNTVVTGGNSTVILADGRNAVFATGDGNTIVTGNGLQHITALGENNGIVIGNTPSTDEGHDARFRTADHEAGKASVIHSGGGLHAVTGDGNVTVVANGGGDFVQVGNGNDSIFLLDGTNPGASTIFLGNGNDRLFLTGEHNTVYTGSGTDNVVDSHIGSNAFIVNAAGGSLTIDNFQSTDHLVLSALFGGAAANLTFATQADPRFGSGAMDTVITATGRSGTAHVVLQNYDGGSITAMMKAFTLTT